MINNDIIRKAMEEIGDELTIDEAREIAEHVVFSLAKAFAGFDQFSDELVGESLLMQAKNNWIPPKRVAEEAARLLVHRCDFENEQDVYGRIASAYNSKRKKLGLTHLPELPL